MNLETYLVGGAVRDTLLGLEPKDLDYVVIGSTPNEMESLGFKQVGADFPVYLHPNTGEEYALARTESKDSKGYCGFTSSWDGVSLHQDLGRRDLTINSMAIQSGTVLIDPYGGAADLMNKTLRHTTEAFQEDPVRVLRVARFLARFGPDWIVAEETAQLCEKIVQEEFKSLTAERVWLETHKALSEPHPELFFKFLWSIDEGIWFKELWDLYDIPQPEKHHPEIWTFKHTMLCLTQGVKREATPKELFAILCHDLGKAPCWEQRGNLHGHEETGVEYVEALCDRLKVPKDYRELAVKVCRWHQYSHKILDVNPKKVHKLFKGLDCIRKPKILESFNLCNWADATGRTEVFQDREYPQASYLVACLEAVKMVDCATISKTLLAKGKTGEVIGEAIRVAQIHSIRGVKK